MAARVWALTAFTLLLAAALLLTPSPRAHAYLRDSHSDPAYIIPQQQVVVTSQGNVFHAPWCKYIQGKGRHPIAGSQAVAEDYAPCVRFMGWTIGK